MKMCFRKAVLFLTLLASSLMTSAVGVEGSMMDWLVPRSGIASFALGGGSHQREIETRERVQPGLEVVSSCARSLIGCTSLHAARAGSPASHIQRGMTTPPSCGYLPKSSRRSEARVLVFGRSRLQNVGFRIFNLANFSPYGQICRHLHKTRPSQLAPCQTSPCWAVKVVPSR